MREFKIEHNTDKIQYYQPNNNKNQIQYRMIAGKQVVYIVNEPEPFTGVITQYYWNGQLGAMFQYENGIEHGGQIVYKPTGGLFSKKIFSNGFLISEIEYDDQGYLKKEFFWEDNSYTCKFYICGKLRKISRKGSTVEYDSSGKIISKEGQNGSCILILVFISVGILSGIITVLSV